VLALELATLELARADSLDLDFAGRSEGACDSATEVRGKLGGGRSGSGLSTALRGTDGLKTCTGITRCVEFELFNLVEGGRVDLVEGERADLVWVSDMSGMSGAVLTVTGTPGAPGGGVTVRVEPSSPESQAPDSLRDSRKAEGGGDGRMVFGSTG
jgi:hypothetical protein